MPSHPVYRFSLEECRLAEVLHSAAKHPIPAVLEAQRGLDSARVYLKDGRIVDVQASWGPSLAQALAERRLLSREDAHRLHRISRDPREMIIRVLDGGRVPPARLATALRERAQEWFRQLFGWGEGDGSLRLGAFPVEHLRLSISVRREIVRGSGRIRSTSRLVDYLGGPEARLRSVIRPEEVVELELGQDEWDLLRRLDGDQTLADLQEAASGEGDGVIRTLFAYRILRLALPVEDHDSA